MSQVNLRPLLAAIFLVSSLLGWHPETASGQATASLPKAEFRIPGAVDKPPGWLKDAPFDLKKFFELPPASQNAAPLYLEALCEFGIELEAIYPPELRNRTDAIRNRSRRTFDIYDAWSKNPEKVDREQIDALLSEYQDALRKLDLAQKRPRCVFAFGVNYDSPVPHASVSRGVVRVLMLRAARSIERDDFPAAIDDFGRILRLSRDLRPRGAAICQLVGIGSTVSFCSKEIPLLLARSKLKVEHCDRLLKLLNDHETQTIDSFSEAVKYEFIMYRSLLREFTEGIKTTLDAAGRPVETKLDRPALVRELEVFLRQIMNKEISVPEAKRIELLDQFARDAAKERDAFIDYTRTLLAAKPGYLERKLAYESLATTYFNPPGLTFFKLIAVDNRSFLEACGRERTFLGAAKCLVALRRWQLTHTAPPKDLAEACRAAKLPGVPLDSFSGKPLKLTTIDGDLVVYSIGPDGVDDNGLKDAEQGFKPQGDYLYRLPKLK